MRLCIMAVIMVVAEIQEEQQNPLYKIQKTLYLHMYQGTENSFSNIRSVLWQKLQAKLLLKIK